MSTPHSSRSQNRQPAGVPIGGQFAASQRASAAVSLAHEEPPILQEVQGFAAADWREAGARFRDGVIITEGRGGALATITTTDSGYHVSATEHDDTMTFATLDLDVEHLRTAVELAEDHLGWGQTGVQAGSRTPWGIADEVVHYAPGITRAYTPSHGGIKLSPERNKEIPPALRNRSGWYEEDCESHVVGMAFPHETRICKRNGYTRDESAEENFARSTARVKDWFPDAYEKATGQAIQLGESHVRDAQVWAEAHKDDWVVTSASSTGEGMVEVLAGRGGERKKFLVPADEYATRSEDNEPGRQGRFVVDPSRHTELAIEPEAPKPLQSRHTGIDTEHLSANQARLVARDLAQRYRDETGRVFSVGELVNTEGITSKSVDIENGKRQYELRVQEREGDPISVYPVSKATFDAVAAPDDRSQRRITYQAMQIAEHKFEKVRGAGPWRREAESKARQNLAQARADYEAAVAAEKGQGNP